MRLPTALTGFTLTEHQKRWARRLGYPFMFGVIFVFSLHFTFPYDRFEELASASLSEYYEVASLDIGPGWWPGHVSVKDVVLRTRPEVETEKPLEFKIDSADVNVGFWALVVGGFAVDIDADIGDGEVSASLSKDGDEIEYELETEDLPLKTVPGIKGVTGGVPIEGGLNAEMHMVLPKGKWKDAEGQLSFSCDGCTIGDGVAKIRPMAPGQGNAFTNEGLTLPKLRLGKIGGTLNVKKGFGEFDKFEAKSADGELYVEAEIRFDDPFKRSQVTGYLRFKTSDELKQREARMGDMEVMMAGAGRRPDGYIGVRIGPGAFDRLRYIASKTSPLGRERDKSTKPTSSTLAGGARPRVEIPPPPTTPTVPVGAAPDAKADVNGAPPAPPTPGVTAAPIPPAETNERPPAEGERIEPVPPPAEPPPPPPPTESAPHAPEGVE